MGYGMGLPLLIQLNRKQAHKDTTMVNIATVLLDACTLLGTTKLNLYNTSITCWSDLKPIIMQEYIVLYFISVP
jgi:hypothetical protein